MHEVTYMSLLAKEALCSAFSSFSKAIECVLILTYLLTCLYVPQVNRKRRLWSIHFRKYSIVASHHLRRHRLPIATLPSHPRPLSLRPPPFIAARRPSSRPSRLSPPSPPLSPSLYSQTPPRRPPPFIAPRRPSSPPPRRSPSSPPLFPSRNSQPPPCRTDP